MPLHNHSLRHMQRKDLNPTLPIHPNRFVNYSHSILRRRLDSEFQRLMPIDDFFYPNKSHIPIYQPIRIHFESSEILQWRKRSLQTEARVIYLIQKVLPTLAAIWSSALNVIPVEDNLVIDYTWCPFGRPTNRAFTTGFSGTDLVVFVTANSEKCTFSSKSLVSGASCYWDQYQRPTAGVLDFCLDNMNNVSSDLGTKYVGNPPVYPDTQSNTLEKDAILWSAVKNAAREFINILGASPYDFVFFYDFQTGAPRSPQPKQVIVDCVSGRREQLYLPYKSTIQSGRIQSGRSQHGKLFYEVTLPTVIQVVRNQFDCESLTGVRLDSRNDEGHCFGSYFDERIIFSKGMDHAQEILNPITLALLQDSGWYLPNFRVSRINPWGRGAGCDFLNKDCIQKGRVPSYGKNFYCDKRTDITNSVISKETYGCDPSHSDVAICDLVDHTEIGENTLPERFQYFEGHPSLGSLSADLDFCPTFTMLPNSCKGFESTDLPKLPESLSIHETQSHIAKCFLTSGTTVQRPICLDVACSVGNSTYYVATNIGSTFTCQEGDVKYLPGSDYKIICPPKSAVCPESYCPANCAGQGICDFSTGNCKCFDENDLSLGCYHTFRGIPPTFIRPWPTSHSNTSFLTWLTIITLLFHLT